MKRTLKKLAALALTVTTAMTFVACSGGEQKTKENSQAVGEYKFLRNVEVLCIDDLGAEPRESMNYGDIITAVTDIMMYRYQEQFCTISTSNLSANEISGYYDERFADRLREMAHIINFGNEKSFRN